MRISEKRKQALANCVFDTVMDSRIAIKRAHKITPENIDAELFQLQMKIWNRQCKILGIQA